jgi:hypothetical protein
MKKVEKEKRSGKNVTENKEEYIILQDKILEKIKLLSKQFINASINDAIRLGLKNQDRRDFVCGRISQLETQVGLEMYFNTSMDDRWSNEEDKEVECFNGEKK